MEYFLKANALISIFYFSYIIFLQRETFFTSNRWFLILGLVVAILLPMMVIPIYVETTTTTSDGFTILATNIQNVPEPFDVSTILFWIYGIGVSFFLIRFTIQFISLMLLIKNEFKIKTGDYKYIKTTQDTTPFSFFKWIVYNPKQFDGQELQLILKHERVHAKQLHSMDVLFMNFATALFWCNPIIWLYRKALKQNLEFIADHHTQKQSDSEECYQRLVLKTSLPEQNLMHINTFYNSTIRLKMFGKQITLFTSSGQIKKRILMLHKSKSNPMNSWKYSIIVPFLVIFVMAFNTKTIAQTSSLNTSKAAAQDQENILKFVITKDTKDKQLDLIKNKLIEKGVTITFKNVKRNSKSEITTIKIKSEYKGQKMVHYKKLSEPISPIEISMNPTDDTIKIGQQSSGLSQTFNVETAEDGGLELKQTKSEKDTLTSKNGSSSHIKRMEDVEILSLEKKGSTAKLFTNKENSPLVILDGKEISNNEMHAINPNNIESIQVLKDRTATNKFGEKGENGVILITSKKEGFLKTDDGEFISIVENEEQKISMISNDDKGKIPLYIMDGKEITKKEMEAINPNTIASVFVLKDETATKKYGKKGANGVILITIKKE